MVPCLASTVTPTTFLLAWDTGDTYISNWQDLVRGGIRGNYISKGETGVRAGQTVGTTGPKWEGGQPSGGYGRRADRDRENVFQL